MFMIHDCVIHTVYTALSIGEAPVLNWLNPSEQCQEAVGIPKAMVRSSRW